MSDAGDLVALLGQLDRTIGQLEGEPAATARAAAATMVPPFGEPDASGWYDRLVTAIGVELGPRSLSEAMTAIAAPAEGLSALPRRLVAIAAVARALPSRFGPDGSEASLTLRALSTPGILASAPPLEEPVPPSQERPIPDEAPVLLARLVDPVELPNVGAYRDFIGRESNRRLLQTALLGLPAPCTTDVVEVTGSGDAGRALALVTNVCVTGVEFADIAAATGFLNPANWNGYPGWCAMIADPPPGSHAGPARYLEIVALDCPSGALKVAVWLDFSPLVQHPQALWRTYKMSKNQEGGASTGAGAAVQTANNAVVVDEGSLKVTKEGTHLRVKTTKRVRFRAGLDVTILRIIACCAGYGALAAEFVTAGTGGSARDVACASAAGVAPLAASDQADPVKERVEAVGQSIDECATALKNSISKAASGAYAADDFTEDVVGAVGRSAQAWTRVADLVATFARPPVPAPDDEVVSDRFALEPPATGPCTLALAGPLLAHHDVAPVPLDCVRFNPKVLAAGADGFALVVQPRGLRGTTYFGVVNVTDATTGQVRQVNVDVQVP
jgi:hypothetical protein